MSLKTFNDQIISSYPSQTNSTSMQVWTNQLIRGSIQVSISSGSLNGTFSLQGSNDQSFGAFPPQFQPTNWNVVGGSTSMICSTSVAGAGSFMFGPFESQFEYLRIAFVAGNTGASLGLYSVRLKGINGG